MKGDLQTSLVVGGIGIEEVVAGIQGATRVVVWDRHKALATILCWHGRETPPSFDDGIALVNGYGDIDE
jgi:hypothetical protein